MKRFRGTRRYEGTFVEQSTVLLIQVLGQVPVVERNDWHNAGLNQIVDKFDIVVYTHLIDRIISST